MALITDDGVGRYWRWIAPNDLRSGTHVALFRTHVDLSTASSPREQSQRGDDGRPRAEGRGRRIRTRGWSPARSAQPRAGGNQREHHSGSLRVPPMLARGAEMSFLLLTIERDVARDLPLQDAAHGVPLHGQPSGETGWLDDLELVAGHDAAREAGALERRAGREQVAGVLGAGLLDGHLDLAAAQPRSLGRPGAGPLACHVDGRRLRGGADALARHRGKQNENDRDSQTLLHLALHSLRTICS